MVMLQGFLQMLIRWRLCCSTDLCQNAIRQITVKEKGKAAASSTETQKLQTKGDKLFG